MLVAVVHAANELALQPHDIGHGREQDKQHERCLNHRDQNESREIQKFSYVLVGSHIRGLSLLVFHYGIQGSRITSQSSGAE